MSQQKQAPETAETYRYFIKQMIDEITDPNDLRRIYTLVFNMSKKLTFRGYSTQTYAEVFQSNLGKYDKPQRPLHLWGIYHPHRNQNPH